MEGKHRRIFRLIGALAALCVLVAAVLWFQHWRIERQLRHQRDAAIRNVERGEYLRARHVLRRHLYRDGMDDVEAMIHLASAITATPVSTRAERVEAMRLLRYVTQRQPESLAAHVQLLELQAELDFHEPLLRTAEHVRARAEDDAVRRRAARHRIEALLSLERYDAALVSAHELARAAPHSLAAQRLVLDVLARGPWPGRRIIDHARAQRDAHPDDVRYRVLLGCAQRLAGRQPEAIATLKRCAALPMPDADTAHLLVTELEAVGRFEQALALLERTVDDRAQPSSRLLRALTCRLWERGDVQAVLTRLAALRADRAAAGDGAPDTQLIALKTMALIERGRRGDAEPLLDTLRERSRTDGRAAAWAVYLGGVFAQAIDADSRLQRCRRALERDPTNPYIRFELAQALAARGERRAAIAAWQRTAETCPAWAAPHLELARAFTDLGFGGQAVQAAQAAAQRVPDAPHARAALAQARRLHMAQGGPESPAALLELVADIQRDHPHEPTTLPIHISLLVEVGQREEAGETLLTALNQRLPPPTLLRLARVSRSHSLGLAEACYAQYEALHGRTPSLAYARAIDHWRRGRADRVWTELTPPRHLEDDEPAQLAWALAHARFHDHIASPEADQVWHRLLDRYPDSTHVYHAALEAEAVRADRQLMRRAIDRLRALTGDDGLAWRLAEGRWLLESSHATPGSLTRAARLLGEARRRAPGLVETRFWLARALKRLGEPEVALAQLNAAVEHAPRHQPVLLELARLRIERGESSEALALLDRVVENRASTVNQLQDAAVMLVRLRGWDEAAAALTRALEAGGRAPRDMLMLGFADEPFTPDPADTPDQTTARP